jgi:hypothetical protein
MRKRLTHMVQLTTGRGPDGRTYRLEIRKVWGHIRYTADDALPPETKTWHNSAKSARIAAEKAGTIRYL